MKDYMILIENPIAEGVQVLFIDDFYEAMDYVESARDVGHWVELYERNARILEGRVVGYEYRRVN